MLSDKQKKIVEEKRKKIIELYVNQKKSIPDVAELIGISRSVVRYHLFKTNNLRSRIKGQQLSLYKAKNNKGNTKKRTEKQKQHIRKKRLEFSEMYAKGFRVNSMGYYEITKGKFKGKMFV